MTSAKILKYELQDVFRSKWVVFYGLFFLIVTDVLFRFGGTGDRVILSLMNVVLIIIPLVAVMLGAMFLYNAREFTELMLTQPITRKSLYWGLYGGLTLPLVAAFWIGVGVPFLIHSPADLAGAGMLLLTGGLLTAVFVALAFWIALRHEDRVRGLGVALLLWLFFSVIYNGLVLFVIYTFAEYPVEQGVIGLTMLNPIDLARILLLLEFDISALMGFTGALFQKFFGSGAGMLVALGSMLAWVTVPLVLSLRVFKRKDF